MKLILGFPLRVLAIQIFQLKDPELTVIMKYCMNLTI